MKAYPKYKDSGVEWLGEIPEGWDVLNFGLLVGKAILGGNYPSGENEEGIPLIKMGNIGRGDINVLKIERLTEETIYDEKYNLDYGDFLFNTRNSLNLVGKTAVWKNEIPKAIYNSNILKIIFKSHLAISFYMNNLFNSNLIVDQLLTFAKGTTSVAAIYYKDLARVIILLPPLPEQKAIASFLDRETQKIDTLISKQEQMISLLEEKRQAMISHAVTKGLNPNAKMKDSGVEWLGEIPDGWIKVCVKYIGNIYSGGTPKSDVAEYWDGDLPWFTPIDLSNEECSILESSKRTISSKGLLSCSAKLLKKDSIILSTRAPIGNLKIISVNYTHNQGCKSIEINNSNHNKYHYYQLLSYKEQLNLFGYGTTFLELSLDNFKNFNLLSPPLPEQKAIAEYLDTQTKKLDILKEKAKSAIELLKEKRSALISSAVTGKIDVRNR